MSPVSAARRRQDRTECDVIHHFRHEAGVRKAYGRTTIRDPTAACDSIAVVPPRRPGAEYLSMNAREALVPSRIPPSARSSTKCR